MGFKVESDFMHEGFRCAVIMTDMGHRCGYVGIPKDHPLHGIEYTAKAKCLPKADVSEQPIGKRGIIPLLCLDENEDYLSAECYFNVHGGITYSGGRNYPVESDGLWWFGYDCAHCDDGKDYEAIENEYVKEIELQFPSHGVVRTNAYCVQECKNLAEQLKAVK